MAYASSSMIVAAERMLGGGVNAIGRKEFTLS